MFYESHKRVQACLRFPPNLNLLNSLWPLVVYSFSFLIKWLKRRYPKLISSMSKELSIIGVYVCRGWREIVEMTPEWIVIHFTDFELRTPVSRVYNDPNLDYYTIVALEFSWNMFKDSFQLCFLSSSWVPIIRLEIWVLVMASWECLLLDFMF